MCYLCRYQYSAIEGANTGTPVIQPINTSSIMRIKSFLLALLLMLPMLSQAQQSQTDMTPEQKQTCTQAFNDFAFRLYRELQPGEGKNENVICSPLSVSLMLGILANGADGNTLQELNTLIGSDLNTMNAYCQQLMEYYNMDDPIIATASYLAVNKKVKLFDDYVARMKQCYKAEAHSLDFKKHEILNTINQWCEAITRGMIPRVLNNLDPTALAVLMNAIYFKGTWVHQFPQQRTHDDNFTREDGTVKKQPLMRQGDEHVTFPYMENDTMQAVRMNYKGKGRFGMTILLPKKGFTTTQLLRDMTAQRWEQLNKQMGHKIVYITMPLFNAERETELNDVMKKLGLQTAFNSSANFSKLAKAPSYIGRMFQKARIEVNESGTEAAAVTVVEMLLGSAVGRERPKIYHFTANHPFLYAITDGNNGNILFLGEYRGRN